MAELMICGDGEVRHDRATVGHIQWAAPFADFGVAGVYDNDSDFGCDCWTEQDDIDDLKGDLEREEAARERAENLLKGAVAEIEKHKAEVARLKAEAVS